LQTLTEIGRCLSVMPERLPGHGHLNPPMSLKATRGDRHPHGGISACSAVKFLVYAHAHGQLRRKAVGNRDAAAAQRYRYPTVRRLTEL
jgi:hypothetical protein